MSIRTCFRVLFFISVLGLMACNDLLMDTPSVEDEDYFSKLILNTQSPDGTKTLFFGEIGKDLMIETQLYLKHKDGSGEEVFRCHGKDLGIQLSWKGNDTLLVRSASNTLFDNKKTELTNADKKLFVVYQTQLLPADTVKTLP